MKTTRRRSDKPQDDPPRKYPYLGYITEAKHSINVGTVVLFTAPKTGVILIGSGTVMTRVGSFHTKWDEKAFKELPVGEEIILTNTYNT